MMVKNHAMLKPMASPSPSKCLTEEKEDCDESFESLLQRARYTLQLLRIAQQNERMMQLQQQRQHVDGKSSSTSSSQWPNKLKKKEQQHHQQLQKEETKTNQPVDDASSSTSSPTSLQENQRTAMDVFISSPTAVNWHDLVKSMRQDRDACESGRPRFSSSRRDLMNLIETITVYKNMDGLDDDDDHSSVTLSLPSESQQTSQSQQSLEDDQRKAMESFLSSPTGLNWDDFVTSLGKDDDRGSSIAKNREETMPTQNTSVDVKPSLLSTRWKLKKFKQQNHNQSSPPRDRIRKSRGAKSLERRIEQILTSSSPTSAIADTTSYKAAGNVGSEMILHDLMTIDEDIALTPKRQ